MEIGILSLFILFIIGGFLGFFVDSFYRSFRRRRFTHAGYFSYIFDTTIPFLPIYGFGLVALYLLSTILIGQNLFIKFLVYAIILSLIELISGLFTKLTLGVRLWDYSKHRFNLFGIIDLKHSIIWGLMGVVIDILFNL